MFGAKQSGVSLIFALLTLMALSLAALALVRSVDTGSLVLGNLGFKQAATAAGDQATKYAIQWLNSTTAASTSLNNDITGGYYASSQDAVDVTGQQSADVKRALVNWDGDGCAYADSSSYGSCSIQPSSAITIDSATTAKYVIFRLCSATGDPNSASVTCAKPSSTTNGVAPKKGKLDYSDYERFANGAGVYYRIVVRVVSARNTTSFIETIVYL
jgi:Tfp pilus assembly protein PilX